MSELKTNKISTNDGNNVAIDNALGLNSYDTAGRDALSSPQAGDTIYNSETGTIDYYNGTAWFASSGTTFSTDVDITYLGVAGGGGAGGVVAAGSSRGPGGAGAGGMLTNVGGTELTLQQSTNYTVSVGAGGTGGAIGFNNGSNGFPTTLADAGGTTYINALGGGYGARQEYTGGTGGSGGGTGNLGGAGGSGTSGQGNDGGNGAGGVGGGGGGGGKGSAGSNASGTTGGNGGAGASNSLSGSAVTYAAGGRGGNHASTPSSPQDGADNTGNGGSGCGGNTGNRGGHGGSGILIVKFPDSLSITIGVGLQTSSSVAGGYKTVIFEQGTGTVSWA